MAEATIREIQHNLAAFVRRAEHGEEIAIRRRRQVVARLVPVDPSPQTASRPNWGEVRERLEHMWGRRQAAGMPISRVLYDSRGER